MKKDRKILLGISAFYHDSAAALLIDGELLAAAQEERFSRKRHDDAFPIQSIKYCLESQKVDFRDVDAIVFYEKPWLKFDRILDTYLAMAPKGFHSFRAAMPSWIKEKLFQRSHIRKLLGQAFSVHQNQLPPLKFSQHHLSHASSAFFASPFQDAAVLCMDGVGEWETTSCWVGSTNTLKKLWSQKFPHSIGMLYSAFTSYTGFKVNSGEYKVMGLAPYGQPKFVQKILDNLIDLKEDGSFRLNMDYFAYCSELKMINSKFERLFGGPARTPESNLTQKEMDLARSIQQVTEEIVLRLGRSIHKDTGLDNICLAGGVALNCVANGRLLKDGPFKNIWVQPASGDAGGALGAALAYWHLGLKQPRSVNLTKDSMKGAYLGPGFERLSIENYLNSIGAVYRELGENEVLSETAKLVAQGDIVGWFSGRMEFGPRALGARSILGDARNPQMQSKMNLKIKFRESFRPFAPSVLAERVQDFFETSASSPYMLLVANLKPEHRLVASDESLFGIDKLNQVRSKLPASTHVDYSARLQTVHADTNPRYHKLLSHLDAQTGCPLLVNTSFNVRGEPIVCTPEEAYRCFMRTDMDYLVIENFILSKVDQPQQISNSSFLEEFEKD